VSRRRSRPSRRTRSVRTATSSRARSTNPRAPAPARVQGCGDALRTSMSGRSSPTAQADGSGRRR
jgi:hypothetical protein